MAQVINQGRRAFNGLILMIADIAITLQLEKRGAVTARQAFDLFNGKQAIRGRLTNPNAQVLAKLFKKYPPEVKQ